MLQRHRHGVKAPATAYARGVSDQAVHDMIADACLREGAEEEITGDFAAYLTARGIDGEDRQAMLASPQRLTIYRRLVRSSLTGVTARLLARTRARMTSVFDASVSQFLQECPPKTHFLKDVPLEFFAWAEPRWQKQAELAPYLIDLARYELLHFDIGSMPRMDETQDLADVAIDRPLAFSSVARLLQVGYAVHRLPTDEEDRTEPDLGPYALLLYRDDDHVVRVLEVGRLAFAALERMFEGQPLGDALRSASEKVSIALTDELLGQMALLLADLGERRVLLGARAHA